MSLDDTLSATARLGSSEEPGDLRVDIELPADADVDPDALETIDVAISRRGERGEGGERN